MVDDATLAKLRQLFAEELADHVARLEDAVATAGRVDPSDRGALDGVAREIKRSAHTLKGSARVTGYDALERLCEAFETRLATPEVTLEPARAVEALRSVLPTLRDAVARLSRGEPVDDAATRAVTLGLRGVAPPPEEAEEPSSDSVFVPAPLRTATMSGDTSRSFASDGETVRVPVASIAGLLTAAQELQAVTGRMRGTRHGALEASLHDAELRLTRALRAIRSLAQAEDDDRLTPLTLAIEGAADALRAAITTSRAQELDHARAWTEARQSAMQISDRSRRLRVRRFAALGTAIEATAHEAAGSLGKRVTVSIEGDDAEVDRRVLEALRDPLLHLVRNAIDHGLESPGERTSRGKPEQGTLSVRASLAGVELTVEIRDDGRGVDLARVRARAAELGLPPGATDRETLANLFEPGFTTRDAPSAISGRGVGLDVVRQRIAQLHGRVAIETSGGVGTTFRIVVPSDLSTLRGLVVRARDTHAVIPTTTIERVVRVRADEVVSIDGRQHVATDRGPVPLADLPTLLGFPARGSSGLDDARHPVVILAIAERRIALRTDAVLDERPVVVQPLGGRIKRLALVSGGVVLQDGELALLLDVGDVLRLARAARDVAGDTDTRVRHVLLVDDSVTTRQLERSLLEAAGYLVSVSADGLDAWNALNGTETFDAIVSDIEMPNLDGFALLARVRSTPRFSRLPVVLVTALASDEDRQRALDLGASAYITKRGFDDEALLDALESLT